MKTILIISLPRSGSTNLMLSLGRGYGFSTFFEQDKKNANPNLYSKGKSIKENSIHKIIVDTQKGIDYYLDLIERFDYTILLDRKDILQQAESYYILRYINKGKVNAQWNDEIIDRQGIRKTEEYKRMLETCKKNRNLLRGISEFSNIEIDYYEDVYSKKHLHNKEIKLDLEYMSERKRCRQSSKQSLL